MVVILGVSKGYGKRETVTNIRGTKVKSLTEGNNLAKETEQKAMSAANYVGDVFQGEKSLPEIGQDIQAVAAQVGESVMQDYVIPVGMNWLHRLEDKYGGKEAKLKRTLEQSYQQGRNTGRVDVIGAEVIASGLSGGMGGAAMKTVTTAAKRTPDGPNRDRTPDGNGRDGSDGNGTPLFGLFDSIKKDMETLDGKFKTKAKTVEDALKDMQEMINSLLAGMQGFSKLVPDTGRPMSFSLDGHGGGGHNNKHGNNKRDNEGTGEANKPNLYDKDGNYTGGRSQKELDDLATDPDRGYVLDEQGEKEREVGLAVEERGELGKIKRDSGGAEFYDESSPTKQRWDVKSYESYPNGHTNPKKGAFSVKRTLENMYKKLNKDINLIIDTRGLIPEHVAQLKDAVSKEGIADRIIWYP